MTRVVCLPGVLLRHTRSEIRQATPNWVVLMSTAMGCVLINLAYHSHGTIDLKSLQGGMKHAGLSPDQTCTSSPNLERRYVFGESQQV